MNQCLMQLRQRWFGIQRVALDALPADGRSGLLASNAPTPEKSAFCWEIASAISKAAARLPKHLGEVFYLHAVSGLTVNEVAEATGLTLSAAKSRLFRAQVRMRQHLQPVWSNVRSIGPAAETAWREAA
jgi:DNA-directed RNA polymerase specialized sigma24 family protein